MNDNNKNKPRPHAKLIHAWADGFTIQTTRRNGEWEDIDLPSWNEKFEYRIKPDNEPWSPKADEKYFYLDVFNGEFCAIDNTWDSTDTDYALRRNKNIFPTKEEAEAMIAHIKDVLKSTTDVSASVDSNVGSKDAEIEKLKDELEALKIDTTLSDGELALIRALRKANVVETFKRQKTRLITEANHRLYTYDNHVAFLTNDSEAVIAALKQIQEEQEANNANHNNN